MGMRGQKLSRSVNGLGKDNVAAVYGVRYDPERGHNISKPPHVSFVLIDRTCNQGRSNGAL
jgi:hypothetical protein